MILGYFGVFSIVKWTTKPDLDFSLFGKSNFPRFFLYFINDDKNLKLLDWWMRVCQTQQGWSQKIIFRKFAFLYFSNFTFFYFMMMMPWKIRNSIFDQFFFRYKFFYLFFHYDFWMMIQWNYQLIHMITKSMAAFLRLIF